MSAAKYLGSLIYVVVNFTGNCVDVKPPTIQRGSLRSGDVMWIPSWAIELETHGLSAVRDIPRDQPCRMQVPRPRSRLVRSEPELAAFV